MKQVAIIGAGLMGHALALVFALGGHRVRLTDTDSQTLHKAMALIEAAAVTLIEAGEADAAWTPERLRAAITPHDRLADAVHDAHLVIEAVAERVDVKTRLFEELDCVAPATAVFASNTSNLDVFPLIPKSRWKRSLITHWYSPPYLVDLVDLVPTPDTDPEVTADIKRMLEEMGKVPIVFTRFITGYVANRLQDALMLEILSLLDEGSVTPAQVDLSVIHGLALRTPILGVIGKADFAGLELLKQGLLNGTYQPPAAMRQSPTLDRLVAAGKGGVRSGEGFYSWKGDAPAEHFHERDMRMLSLKKALRDIGPMVPRSGEAP
jgi:3-hydroxybutyryl-CoA dehydrogenase